MSRRLAIACAWVCLTLAVAVPAGASDGTPVAGATSGSSSDLVTTVAGPADALAGETVSFIADVTNRGLDPASAVAIHHEPSEGALPMSLSSTRGSCDLSTLTCSVDVIEVGGTAQVTLRLGVPTEGPMMVTVTASSDTPEETPDNNSATGATTVSGPSCTVIGTAGDDNLPAGAAGDVVCGFDGDDHLESGAGDDVLSGGSGVDSAGFHASSQGVTADLPAGTASGHGVDELRDIEHLVGSPLGDRLLGDDGPNGLAGQEGTDRLEGGAADDVLAGGLGADRLILGPGDDEAAGGSGGDTVSFSEADVSIRLDLRAGTATGEGTDTFSSVEHAVGSDLPDDFVGNGGANRLEGGPGADVLDGRGGDDVLAGGTGVDTADYSDAPRKMTVSLRRGTATGWGTDRLEGVQHVVGSSGDDWLQGSASANRLLGGRGTDTLLGLGGRDLLLGGPRPDTLVGGDGVDALRGGSGRDSCVQGVGDGTKRSCEALGLAVGAGVTIFWPARRWVGTGYHESLFWSAAAMRPLGRLRLNDNPAEFDPPPPTDGSGYVVMASRGRPTGATTSVDVVLGSDTPVVSPVNGVVVLVRSYDLYCRVPDVQVFIRPRGASDIRVGVFHLTAVRVRPGDRVIASVTALGLPRVLGGGGAQEDRYFPGPYPHVHLEVERNRATPVPGCL